MHSTFEQRWTPGNETFAPTLHRMPPVAAAGPGKTMKQADAAERQIDFSIFRIWLTSCRVTPEMHGESTTTTNIALQSYDRFAKK